MIHNFNVGIARRYGVNAALVAQYIRDQVCENEFHNRYCYDGRCWMRCSQMMFTAVMPYLSRHAVRRALEYLMKQGVLIRREFGADKFDRTSWYAFTQFGQLLMRESEDENYE